MKLEVKQAICDILDTIEEALLHLQQNEQEELRQTVVLGRAYITSELERELGCSLEHRINISALSDEDWLRTISIILSQIEDPFCPQNVFDKEFITLLEYIWKCSKQDMLKNMRINLSSIQRVSQETYQEFVDYFSRFPLWGTFDPDKGDYQTFEFRVDVLKQHSYDFLWLYCRLEDYLSKRTLYAILLNWAVLDTKFLHSVKSIFPDYWEPDVFPNNKDDVLVDVGAYVGDSILHYVQTYGTDYSKIYAYEITDDNLKELKKNTAHLHNIIVRPKGAGATRGSMVLTKNEDSSANKLSAALQEGKQIEIVPLDEDIQDHVTFIKMDIEGAEQDALIGCQNIIGSQHPKLAICTYHGYEDIWKIPLMIDAMYPEYQFYLRHNGGNLIPTEFVLLCKSV